MVLATVLALAALGLPIFAAVKSILNERTKGRSIWQSSGWG
jgi:hypothetical protein